jgi:hypothetical protein
MLISLAKVNNLVVTAGSDWHGKNFSRSPMGIHIPTLPRDMMHIDHAIMHNFLSHG